MFYCNFINGILICFCACFYCVGTYGATSIVVAFDFYFYAGFSQGILSARYRPDTIIEKCSFYSG